jgi:hypothetical protein
MTIVGDEVVVSEEGASVPRIDDALAVFDVKRN